MAVYNNPIVLQRADPWVLKVDGEYYFTGSDPEYNCIAIRHASNINDLQKAPETVVWRKQWRLVHLLRRRRNGFRGLRPTDPPHVRAGEHR